MEQKSEPLDLLRAARAAGRKVAAIGGGTGLSTLLLGLLTAAAAWACLSFWIPVLVLPAVAALLASLPLERIFRPYLELPGGGETEE